MAYENSLQLYNSDIMCIDNSTWSEQTILEYLDVSPFGDALSTQNLLSFTDDLSESTEPEEINGADYEAVLTELDGNTVMALPTIALQESYQEWMRTISSTATLMDHGILSAGSYDDFHSKTSETCENKSQTNQRASKADNAPSKAVARGSRSTIQRPGVRARDSPRTGAQEGSSDEDPAGKKPRGRPRLDCQYDTAADRRRTQIRVAQRIYRQRKQSTISALQKRTQHLEGVVDGMNNSFLGLYDATLTCPDFQNTATVARQLKKSVGEFLVFAQAAHVDSDDGA